MMECTPESGSCHSVYSVGMTIPRFIYQQEYPWVEYKSSQRWNRESKNTNLTEKVHLSFLRKPLRTREIIHNTTWDQREGVGKLEFWPCVIWVMMSVCVQITIYQQLESVVAPSWTASAIAGDAGALSSFNHSTNQVSLSASALAS